MLNDLINHQVNKINGNDDDKDNNDNQKSKNGPDGSKKTSTGFNNLDKQAKFKLVSKLKEEVPTVLLNKWLDIGPERSKFAAQQPMDSDEISSYSDSTISNRMSMMSTSFIKKTSQFCQNNNGPEPEMLQKGSSEDKPLHDLEFFDVEKERKTPKAKSDKAIETVQEIDSSSNNTNCDLDTPQKERVLKNKFLAKSDYSVSDSEDEDDIKCLELNRSDSFNDRLSNSSDSKQVAIENEVRLPHQKVTTGKIKCKRVLLRNQIKRVMKNSNLNFGEREKSELRTTECSSKKNSSKLLNLQHFKSQSSKSRLDQIAKRDNKAHMLSYDVLTKNQNSGLNEEFSPLCDDKLTNDTQARIRISKLKPLRMNRAEAPQRAIKALSNTITPLKLKFKMPEAKSVLRSKCAKLTKGGSQKEIQKIKKPRRSLNDLLLTNARKYQALNKLSTRIKNNPFSDTFNSQKLRLPRLKINNSCTRYASPIPPHKSISSPLANSQRLKNISGLNIRGNSYTCLFKSS